MVNWTSMKFYPQISLAKLRLSCVLLIRNEHEICKFSQAW